MPRPVLTLLTAAVLLAVPSARSEDRVEFEQDVRPILSDKCFTCHGPSDEGRASEFRLDSEKAAREGIVAGNPAQSKVYQRITHENEALRMPPSYAAKKLSQGEIETLRRWIEQGAEWKSHWAFTPPQRPDLPEIPEPSWAKSPLDYFTAARLGTAGLHPSPEADRTTLIRRLSFDLTGLPPTIQEVEAFLGDERPDAYDRLVDRLLDSPRYGERMAIRWLDASRYADTNGYQTDAERVQWRWRDWVIDAFNSNKPFDQFTIEQLAGDLLPNPTVDQIVATGFSRNHRGNSEGGIVAEEYLVEYSVDRVETMSTVWLGLTLGCTRCHDHKYDPFTQKEFYQLFAYFNNIPERGRVFKFGNTPPLIAAPTAEQRRELEALDAKLEAARKRFEQVRSEPHGDFQTGADWVPMRDFAAYHSLDGGATSPAGPAETFDGKRSVEMGDEPNFGYLDAFTISAWVKADDPNGAIVSKTDRALDDQGYGFGGWGLYLIDGKLKFFALQRWLDDGLRVATAKDLPLGEWHHVAVSYDGERFAKGVKFYVDGREWETVAELDFVNQEIRRKGPILVGDGGGLEKGFQGAIDEVRLYSAALPANLIQTLATAETPARIASLPAAERTPGQTEKLRLAYLEKFGPEDARAAWKNLIELERERVALTSSFPTVMVMQELPTLRETHRLDRGVYDAPAEKVERKVPAVLPPMPSGVPNNRLGLAKWLVSDDHPLTSRVAVNRFWQMFFGRGIVKTVEDFGSQGEPPTHPLLLDWLAREFIESGWDVKHLVKTIVTSATYRQSSAASPELVARDPENRLLARGPRVRLPAEMVRDSALAVSELLVEHVGGPSVKPYQPAGIWEELSGQEYEQGTGEDLYRRSLYTFWKRSAPPPFMMNFDSAGREACTVLAHRTNTPLQALNLMNDVTYVEAARKLAERMMREGGEQPADRIEFGFRTATARLPKPDEEAVLMSSYQHYLDRYLSRPEAATKFLTQGESPRDESLPAVEHAAYSAVAGLILNLDETITKE